MDKTSHLDENGLDPRHASIIDALPVYKSKKEVLVVGCGNCKKDNVLKKMGYEVTSTDYVPEAKKYDFQEKRLAAGMTDITIHNANILDLSTFPKPQYESVICAEVLEHLVDYKVALKNLLSLSERRLIITVPWQYSFNDTAPPPKGHCNFWNDNGSANFKNINEYKALCEPYAVSIQKIRTKPKDVQMGQYSYLIIVDKQQKWNK
tara:strand:+ start:170 stop:787 length:618 start_codon:yes stop_codon:yes gene_type:complete